MRARLAEATGAQASLNVHSSDAVGPSQSHFDTSNAQPRSVPKHYFVNCVHQSAKESWEQKVVRAGERQIGR